jgi:hypothetical protein
MRGTNIPHLDPQGTPFGIIPDPDYKLSRNVDLEKVTGKLHEFLLLFIYSTRPRKIFFLNLDYNIKDFFGTIRNSPYTKL